MAAKRMSYNCFKHGQKLHCFEGTQHFCCKLHEKQCYLLCFQVRGKAEKG